MKFKLIFPSKMTKNVLFLPFFQDHVKNKNLKSWEHFAARGFTDGRGRGGLVFVKARLATCLIN